MIKRPPEFGRMLARLGLSVSDSSDLKRSLLIAMAIVNAAVVCLALLLPITWYSILILICVSLAWNAFIALSISAQITTDHVDISKNRVLFKRFQNTTKYFESMLQDTSDMIISLDKEYLIFKFNTGAQKLFGYSQEEILGKPFEMLFLNTDEKDKLIRANKTGGKTTTAEISMKTKSGDTIIVNMGMSKMRDEGYVVTAQDITEKKKLEVLLKQKSEQLNRLAITDDLTGLYNSRHFYIVIKSELSRIKRHPDRKLALMYMDVDKFKEYNDTEGHLMGDSVLKALGDVINSCLRKDVDSGFRYGGDEFVVVLPDTDLMQSKVAADRILNKFTGLKLGNTSLSIGIAEATTEDDEKTLVRRADKAMYDSKKKGGRCVTLAGA